MVGKTSPTRRTVRDRIDRRALDTSWELDPATFQTSSRGHRPEDSQRFLGIPDCTHGQPGTPPKPEHPRSPALVRSPQANHFLDVLLFTQTEGNVAVQCQMLQGRRLVSRLSCMPWSPVGGFNAKLHLCVFDATEAVYPKMGLHRKASNFHCMTGQKSENRGICFVPCLSKATVMWPRKT